MSDGPVDIDGSPVTGARILDNYLNTGDYDDYLNGYVTWLDDKLAFAAGDTDEVFTWKLVLEE